MNYENICQNLLSGLSEREKEVIIRRFGLKGREKETLEAVGRDFGVCRERIRQIQEGAMKKIKEKIEIALPAFESFSNYLEKWGGLRKEEILLSELGGKAANEVFFLLSLSQLFRFPENEEFWAFWALKKEIFEKAKKIIESAILTLKKRKTPLSIEELELPIENQKAKAILEISKRIGQTKKGLFGLKEWPEVTPRGLKDKAYLVLKEAKVPLHFKEIARMIGEKCNVHSVHNELIKDERFVLVGRGIYGLREWGFIPGEVKEIIAHILTEKKRPLSKEEIIEEVLKQRIVKKTTILMNLSNKNYFIRDENGKYRLKSEFI